MNELVKPESHSILPSKETRATLAKETSPFVQTIKLLQGPTKEANLPGNSAGDFFITAADVNLSSTLQIVIIHRRDHALLFSKGNLEKESFDANSDAFEEIKTTVSNRPQKIDSSYGHDWLLYLPRWKRFVSYFCGRKSSRPVSEDILDCITPIDSRDTSDELLMEKPFTRVFELHSHYEELRFGKDNSCFVPKVTPLEIDPKEIIMDVTEGERMINMFMKSVHASAVEVEEAAEDETR